MRPAVAFVFPAFLVGLVGATLTARDGDATRGPGYSTNEAAQLTQYALVLSREQEDLKRQIVELRAALDEIQRASSRASAETLALQARIDALKEEAGLTDRSGAGVIVTLDDARLPPTRDSRLVAPAIVHSQDITDVLNAAWKGGATAIAVNGERITGASACVGATIQINGTLLSPPFVVEILGPVEALMKTMSDPDELRDLHTRRRSFGLRFDVRSEVALRVPAYSGPLNVRFAVPY